MPALNALEAIGPAENIYGNARLTTALRQRVVTEIDQIIWCYVLGPESRNLPARGQVQEIQVFEIALKTGNLREDVLRTIDRTIPSLLFFELTFQDRVRFAAAHKRVSDADATQTVVDTYFETPWQDASIRRQPMPVALHMAELY